MSQPDYHQEAKHLDDWVRWTFRESNFDKLSEIYRNLPKVLDTVFEQWADSPDPAVLADVLALLLPGYADNLFAVLWREEAKTLRFPFNLRRIPDYARWLLKRRNIKAVPAIYEKHQILLEQGQMQLPLREFYLFTFMYYATRRRGQRAPMWFESQTFLSTLFANPFLILFSQMLVHLDPVSQLNLLEITEDYLMNPVARRPLDYPEPWRLPLRHECELLLMMLYVLQSPMFLLAESHRIQSVRPEALLLSMKETFYLFFKNACLHWNAEESYPAYIAEVWLRYLTPWKSSRILDEFLTYDFLRGISKIDSPSHDFHFQLVYYSGTEIFWEDYITENLLCYTELFEIVMKMLCGQLLMRSGDIDLLRRISDIYAVDEDGRTVCGHLNVITLDEMSHGAKLTQNLANLLRVYGLDPKVLSPFKNPQVKYIVETLYFKAGQMGSSLTSKIAHNWKYVFNLEPVAAGAQSTDGDDEAEKWRRPGEFPKSSVPIWERPLRSDELWILFQLSWALAKLIDRIRHIDSTYPTTNVRFFASYLNLLYLCLFAFLAHTIFLSD